MDILRRKLLKGFAFGIPALQLNPSLASRILEPSDQEQGPFKPTRQSLRSYEIPDWFKDAKFGIWAHWGPQSAIEAGDWYARNMYIQGERQYNHHLAQYGHPSKVGYKDTIPLWKAEKFDADYLLGLYKKAGAKYFMSMGVHHDNFDLWNSKHHHWNAVEMGPRKDIVGMFRKAALKHGLKFGISDHLWITYKWFSTSKGKDSEGSYAGIPYDGANSKYADLYGTCDEVHKKLDWNENGIPEAWKKNWFDRIKDLIDQYEPDLLYCDGHLPFEEYGLNILAHLYNTNALKHGGRTQAVYTSKRQEDSNPESGICVFDVERGVVDSIWPRAWQTDTCIGDWHYNKDKIGRYKSVKTIIDMLVDIVSRNGNLMLNFPLPASGMLDSDELSILSGITSWMNVNSEGIYSTRPWKIFGYGPSTTASKEEARFNENIRKSLTAEDIRFTTKKGALYAFFMGWPESRQIVIKLSSAGQSKQGVVQQVELLGFGKVEYSQNEEGITIALPSQKPCENAYALKITGLGLV